MDVVVLLCILSHYTVLDYYHSIVALKIVYGIKNVSYNSHFLSSHSFCRTYGKPVALW